MKVESLIDFLDCAVDTRYVQGAYDERGGVMIVGPPGSFKTTIICSAIEPHPTAMIVSDLNVQQWLKMKDDFVIERFTCLGFTDFEKVYQRHPATAQNIEGIIKALVSEGFGTGPGGDQRMPRMLARALVVGGMTQNCLERNYDNWQKNGFLRRFIWLLVGVQNSEAITQAIRRWEKIEFGKIAYRPANKQIRVSMGPERSKQIEKAMKYQAGLQGTGYVLMKKIVAVMEWKYGNNGRRNRVSELLEDISPALSKDGGKLVL